jgi:hypothetical protein
MECCPVCMLRKGLPGGVESGESFFEEASEPMPKQAAQRFGHYELLKGKMGNQLSWAGVRWGSLTKRSMSICDAP